MSASRTATRAGARRGKLSTLQERDCSREEPMRADKSGICALGLVIALGLAGCAGSGSATTTAPIGITDLASIAGKGVGLLEIAGSRDRDDYGQVTIAGGRPGGAV